MTKLRIYVDTSVVGGYFDNEFREDTRRFFGHVLEGKIAILYSDALTKEIEKAPPEVFIQPSELCKWIWNYQHHHAEGDHIR